MATAGDVIASARDSNPEFHERAIPDKVALRALHRLERNLVKAGMEANADIFMVNNIGSEISVGNNAAKKAGFSLPNALKYGDMYINYTGSDPVRRELTVLDDANRQFGFSHPAAVIEGKVITGTYTPTLFPIDPQGDGWDDEDTRLFWDGASSIEVHYIADVTEYTALTDDIQSHPGIFDALVEAVTAWMGKRLLGKAIDPMTYSTLKQDAADARNAWVEEVTNTAEYGASYVRMVY
ncbi:MAG: hypothetical protein AMS18_00070 [Gemmatimonas sp. SG8_17]|nr:MAG: hypothetical protein AMS18_00070 [Gemmatimonas sp. SG8_17]